MLDQDDLSSAVSIWVVMVDSSIGLR